MKKELGIVVLSLSVLSRIRRDPALAQQKQGGA